MPKISKDELLHNENYEVWKQQARAYLIGKDMWDYVDGSFEKTELNSHFWEHNDRKASAAIIDIIDPSQIKIISGIESSHLIWGKLRETYESTGHTRLMSIIRSVHAGKFLENEDIRNQVNTFFDNVQKLRNLGIVYDNRSLSIMFLENLPSSFEMFKTSILSIDSIIDADSLRSKICEEYDSRRKMPIHQVENALIIRQSIADVTCFNCQRKGHYA